MKTNEECTDAEKKEKPGKKRKEKANLSLSPQIICRGDILIKTRAFDGWVELVQSLIREEWERRFGLSSAPAASGPGDDAGVIQGEVAEVKGTPPVVGLPKKQPEAARQAGKVPTVRGPKIQAD